MPSFSKHLIASLVLFLGCVCTGLYLDQRKVLWIDEFYTQKMSIDKTGYGDILRGNFIEGNKSPLFYLIQKAISDAHRFHLPVASIDGLNRIQDARSQRIMRLSSNVFMSLAITLLFYFFLSRFGWVSGLYALAVIMATPMVWQYWVEARPYSLWFFLTTIQLIFLAQVWEKKLVGWRETLTLGAIHALLALTVLGSVFQIAIAGLLLCVHKPMRRHLWLSVGLPLAVVCFYVVIFPTYKFKTFFFWPNLLDAILPERVFIVITYAIMLALRYRQSVALPGRVLLMSLYGLFVSSAVFLLATHINVPDWKFGFFSRYLIYLVPLDIMLTVMARHDMSVWFKRYRWVVFNIHMVLLLFLVVRGLLTYRTLVAVATYSAHPL